MSGHGVFGAPASVAPGELVALGTNGEFYRLGHHRHLSFNGVNSWEYYKSPHGTLSPDGKRVLFGSRWLVDDSAAPIQAYVVDVSNVCP